MRKIFKMLGILTLMTSLVACSAGGAQSSGNNANSSNDAGGSEDLPVLRVATMPFINSLPTEYIKQNKLDEKAGFKIETTMFASGAPMNEALAADLWDVGSMGAAAVTGVANYDMVIIGEVLEAQDGQGIFARDDSKLAQVKGHNPSYPTTYGDPETVKGSTILLPIGTAQHFTTLKWLEAIGVKAEDVNIVNMDTVQAYQALQAGRADAAALNVPTFFDAINDNMVQVGNLAQLGTKYVDMVVANKKSIENKSELIEKYMQVTVEACEALSKDNEMAIDMMMAYLKEAGSETPRESIASDLERLKFLTREDWVGREVGKFAKELGDFYIGVGQLEPDLIDKFDTNIDSGFMDSILK